MKLKPQLYLSYNGQCEAAFRFYERCLNGKIAYLLTWDQSPMANQAPPGWSGKVFHATMTIGETVVFGADHPVAQDEKPRGFYVILGVDDPGDAERVFHALAENGIVHMPIQETFWTLRFGVLVDQFGIPWKINCEKLKPEAAVAGSAPLR